MNSETETPPVVDAIAPSAPAPFAFRMVGDMAPLFAALAEATASFQPIAKDRHVKVVTREKGTYEFDYATLEEVLRCTDKALAANGLKVWHFLCDALDGAREIHHMLSHRSGAYLEAVQVIKMKEGDGWQQFGSAVTYSRRYQVQCMLGVSAENDDDGNAADGNAVQAQQQRQPVRREPPAPAAPPSVPPVFDVTKGTPIQPQPTKTLVDAGTGEPLDPEVSKAIAAGFRAIGHGKGPEVINICKTVTGKIPAQLDQADGQRLLGWLRAQAAEKGVTL